MGIEFAGTEQLGFRVAESLIFVKKAILAHPAYFLEIDNSK